MKASIPNPKPGPAAHPCDFVARLIPLTAFHLRDELVEVRHTAVMPLRSPTQRSSSERRRAPRRPSCDLASARQRQVFLRPLSLQRRSFLEAVCSRVATLHSVHTRMLMVRGVSVMFRCARLSPALSAGEIPAPERGMSHPTGNRVLGS